MDTLIERYIQAAWGTAAENMILRGKKKKKSQVESLLKFLLQNQLTAQVVLQLQRGIGLSQLSSNYLAFII